MNSHPVKYKLPPLGYAYDALAPAYSAELLELHYTGHHKAYVDGLNKALEGLAEARHNGDFARLNALEKDLAFHYSGHVLHSLFWRNLEPNEGAPPSGHLESRIRTAFGGTDAFRRQFGAAGTALQGSGWVALTWETTAGRCSSSSCATTRTAAPWARCPSSSWTCGSTRTTSSTATTRNSGS